VAGALGVIGEIILAWQAPGVGFMAFVMGQLDECFFLIYLGWKGGIVYNQSQLSSTKPRGL